ncbi:hypothetical protein M5K25_004562 [Dendrobium thyrsiflorum]|uniref:CCHC-type domain-containing protein n=1 Tax=Dendrobium thyrsiflorum TaxID=117978 RepID=A0ABD0VFF8_DENTH
MTAKKVDALEERLEGEMNQIKETMEERISSMEGQVADLRDMMKKMLEFQTQTAASKARGPKVKNTNSEIRREEDEVEIVEGERRRPHLKPFQKEDRGGRYGERQGIRGAEQMGVDWERQEGYGGCRGADFEGRRGVFEGGLGYERAREDREIFGNAINKDSSMAVNVQMNLSDDCGNAQEILDDGNAVQNCKSGNPSAVNAGNDMAGKPWARRPNVKINFKHDESFLSEDGVDVKLFEPRELRRQWIQFGKFHLAILGLGWVLCSFSSYEAMEGVLSGGPWFVNGHIVGLDKWTPEFSPTSLKGLTSPIWVRLPHLPLYCWDEINISRIASLVGSPLLLNGNMFQWGRREFARICVRVALDKQLPSSVWVDGLDGRFFQKMEYEKISTFCFKCGKIGHLINDCSLKEKSGAMDGLNRLIPETANNELSRMLGDYKGSTYGPWIHVSYGKKRKVKAPFRHVQNSFNPSKTAPVYVKKVQQLQTADRVPEVKNSCGASSDVLPVIIEEDQLKVDLELPAVEKGVEAADLAHEHSDNQVVKINCPVNVGREPLPIDANMFSLLETDGVDANSQVLVGELDIANKGVWLVATVYGSRDCVNRKSLWSSLEMLSCKFIPAVIGGDFNCILSQDDKKGGFHKSRTIMFEDVWATFPASYAIVRKSWKKSVRGILNDFERLCRNFLWHKKDASKGLHYVAWDVLCKPKGEGGWELQSVVEKIGPLRAKFAWNFISKPNSLLNRTLVSKYGSNVWNSECKNNSSPSWKIVLNGAKFFHPIVRWKLSTGMEVNTIKDTWILDKCIEKWPTFVDNMVDETEFLSAFICDGKWNKSLLKQFFGQHLVDLIVSVPIQSDLLRDQLELLFKCSGKSISALALEKSHVDCVKDIDWSWVKKLKLRSHIDLFRWRLKRNAFPCNQFLKYRRLVESTKEELASLAEAAKDLLNSASEFGNSDVCISENSAEDTKEDKCFAKVEREKIVISILDDKGGQQQFRLFVDDKFERLFKTYAEKVKVKPESLVFSFDGERVSPTATPAGLGLEKDDIIQVNVLSSFDQCECVDRF